MKKTVMIIAILTLTILPSLAFGGGYDDFRVSATVEHLASKPNEHIYAKNIEGTVILSKTIVYQAGYSGHEYYFSGKSGTSILLFLPKKIPLIPDGTRIRVPRGDWGNFYPGNKTYLFGWEAAILGR